MIEAYRFDGGSDVDATTLIAIVVGIVAIGGGGTIVLWFGMRLVGRFGEQIAAAAGHDPGGPSPWSLLVVPLIIAAFGVVAIAAEAFADWVWGDA